MRTLPLLCAILLAACGGPAHYVHPQADLSTIKAVAILPFEATTQERTPADKVQKIFLTELLITGAFEVVEPGLVLKGMREVRAETPATLTPSDIKKLGELVGAQAVFFGTVVDFGEGRGGSTATEVTIQLRLVETRSGITVWSASQTRSGTSLATRLFGFGGKSPTEAAQELIRQQLATLLR